MPSQVLSSVENNFTKGLITEFTGLNFPENAATDTDNCEYTIIGNVKSRLGIDLEEGFDTLETSLGNSALSTYKWNSAGGDSTVQVIVVQIGTTLRFYKSSAATDSSPLSAQLLLSTVNMTEFVPAGGSPDPTKENTYADGNGYLFVFNPSCETLYCTYNNGTITATTVNIKVRDFSGVPELDVSVNLRPTSLTTAHQYNLGNQGWTTGSGWGVTSAEGMVINSLGSRTYNVGTVTGITLGDTITGHSNATYWFPGGPIQYGTSYVVFGGTVTAYSDPFLTMNITSCNTFSPPISFSFTINQTNKGFIDAWHTAEGNYPSNADVWWYFKNTSSVFDPATTQPNISLSAGNAPQGHYIYQAFNQDRGSVSGLSGLSTITTIKRPSNGAWFQGRVWYTGVDASQQPTGNALFYSWSENIYFSQVNVGSAINFGNCYQTNDPTSENLFDLLPTDGGVIQIQGSGKVYKLFPTQNGMLVFAANGVWFITGSQGIGFAANDYTITKISSIESFSEFSYVNVTGMPYFWNEEGIYAVQPKEGGGLGVDSLTVGTIKAFYDAIPKQSKQYARGAYHPIDYTIQWVYRSTNADTVTDRYKFDRILNLNTYNKAFFPYSVDNTSNYICGIVYVQGPGGTGSPEPVFKYLAYTAVNAGVSFAEEFDTDNLDWTSSGTGISYSSYLVTGYKLHGQAQRRFQMPYIYMFSNAEQATAYNIQSVWDYASSGNSGKWSSIQQIFNNKPYFRMIFRRHRLRGQGLVLQIKVSSVPGYPFDIMGWSTFETANQGV